MWITLQYLNAKSPLYFSDVLCMTLFSSFNILLVALTLALPLTDLRMETSYDSLVLGLQLIVLVVERPMQVPNLYKSGIMCSLALFVCVVTLSGNGL